MRVLLDCCSARTVARAGLVTVEAKFVDRLSKLRVVVRAVDIVAIEAGNSAAIHYALDEIISLHAVFVRRAVGEMGEALLAELVVFEFPEIREIFARVVADRPVVIISFHRIR